jgi:hypothetical protein
MKLKNFKNYSLYYSKDPKNFEKRVALASPIAKNLEMFEVVNTLDEVFQVSKDIPVIPWNDFKFSNSEINESFCSTVYNQKSLPTKNELNSEFKGTQFIPNIVTDRLNIKKMKFPIIAKSDDSEEEFKTYGKFKKSEGSFNSFQEKLIPTSRFEILVSGDSPIHVQKKVNQTPFDIDMNRWKHLGEASEICKKINSKWSPEYYTISLTESDGKLYLESIGRSSTLTPAQGVKLYESAYEDYYSANLPSWIKKKLFTDHVKPYYKQKYYDSLLLKPSGVIDYSKYIE